MCRTCRSVTGIHVPWWFAAPINLSSTLGISPNAIPPLTSTPNRAWCVMFPSLCPYVLPVQLSLVSENMQCMFFCSCVSLLRMMVSSFIHVPAKDKGHELILFMAALYSMVYTCHIFLVQSIIDGDLGWFQVFVIVNSAAINIHVHASL